MLIFLWFMFLTIVYCASAHGVYKTTKFLHEEGRWKIIEPDTFDVFLMFCPALNTVTWIGNLILVNNDKIEMSGKGNEPRFASKVFNIDKKKGKRKWDL